MISTKFAFFRKTSGLLVAVPIEAVEWIDPAPEAPQPTPTPSTSPETRSQTKAATKPVKRKARLRPTLRQARGDITR